MNAQASSISALERVYLAAPYSHPDADIREARYRAATSLAARLMAKGCKVFSPITHCHPFAASCPNDPLFWKAWYMTFLERWASLLLVHQLPGWETSQGVACEIAYAKKHGLAILHLPEGYVHEL